MTSSGVRGVNKMITNRIRDIAIQPPEETSLSLSDVLKFLQSASTSYGAAKKIQVTIEYHQHERNYYLLNPQATEPFGYIAVPPQSSSSRAGIEEDAEMRTWRDEASHFEKIKPRLWKDKNYRHKYVAIRRRTIVDVDDDKFRLAKRVKQKYADDVVFIAKVQISARVVELPSPEVGP